MAINHGFLGDLVIKLASPNSVVTTLMSRPGVNEPNDGYYEPNGDSSNLDAGYPIHFDDSATVSAEDMGSTISGTQEACKDDQRCDYRPSSGAGPGSGLSDFAGQDPVGSWQLCVADGDSGDAGTLEGASLSVLAW